MCGRSGGRRRRVWPVPDLHGGVPSPSCVRWDRLKTPSSIEWHWVADSALQAAMCTVPPCGCERTAVSLAVVTCESHARTGPIRFPCDATVRAVQETTWHVRSGRVGSSGVPGGWVGDAGQGESGYVMAESQAGVVVDAGVDAGVDAAQARLR